MEWSDLVDRVVGWWAGWVVVCEIARGLCKIARAGLPLCPSYRRLARWPGSLPDSKVDFLAPSAICPGTSGELAMVSDS